jgi:hypothetical protein
MNATDFNAIACRVFDRHGISDEPQFLNVEMMRRIGTDLRGELEAASATDDEIAAFLVITIANISKDEDVPEQQRQRVIDSLCDGFGWDVECRGTGDLGHYYSATRRRIH